MSNSIILLNPQVIINNVPVGVIPNSISYTEGLGEQIVRVFSAGGNNFQTAFGNNVESNMSTLKFSLIPTSDNVAIARVWKIRGNDNSITISDDNFTRTFRQAALLNNYEVNTSQDGNIDLEFTGLTAV